MLGARVLTPITLLKYPHILSVTPPQRMGDAHSVVDSSPILSIIGGLFQHSLTDKARLLQDNFRLSGLPIPSDDTTRPT